ncbi:MAG: DUF4147 domain-containing protein [bacterium]|nr:DUF4147 domain-containing protein [bacterium]
MDKIQQSAQLIRVYYAGLGNLRDSVGGLVPNIDAPINVIATGKGAFGVADALRANGNAVTKGLIIAKEGQTPPEGLPDTWRIHYAAHPVPSTTSADAARLVQEFERGITAADGIRVRVITGGSSSMLCEFAPEVCEALAERYSPEEIGANKAEWREQIGRYFIESAMDIHEINAIRRLLFAATAGRFLGCIPAGKSVKVGIVSDVIPKAADKAKADAEMARVVGSAPYTSSPLPRKREYAEKLAALKPNAPQILRDILELGAKGKITSGDQAAVPEIHVIDSNHLAVERAADMAKTQFPAASIHPFPAFHPGVDATALAKEIATIAKEKHHLGGEHVLIFGTEPTTDLSHIKGAIPPGGRMQHTAFAIIPEIATLPITVLCGATDGDDGVGGFAGAWVSGADAEKCAILEINIQQTLTLFKSQNALERLNRLLPGGQSPTNLADIIIVHVGK